MPHPTKGSPPGGQPSCERSVSGWLAAASGRSAEQNDRRKMPVWDPEPAFYVVGLLVQSFVLGGAGMPSFNLRFRTAT